MRQIQSFFAGFVFMLTLRIRYTFIWKGNINFLRFRAFLEGQSFKIKTADDIPSDIYEGNDYEGNDYEGNDYEGQNICYKLIF